MASSDTHLPRLPVTREGHVTHPTGAMMHTQGLMEEVARKPPKGERQLVPPVQILLFVFCLHAEGSHDVDVDLTFCDHDKEFHKPRWKSGKAVGTWVSDDLVKPLYQPLTAYLQTHFGLKRGDA